MAWSSSNPDQPAVSLKRVHLWVRGSVQGVGFRYRARERAQSLGLSGGVSNCPDGSVEAVVQGSDEAVQQFVGWTQRGPSLARVERVDVQDEQPEPEMQTFGIK